MYVIEIKLGTNTNESNDYTILFQNKDKYFLDSANKISVFFETEALEEDGKLKVHPRVSLNKVNYFKRVISLVKLFSTKIF